MSLADEWAALVSEANRNPTGSIGWVDATTILFAEQLLKQQNAYRIEILKGQKGIVDSIIDHSAPSVALELRAYSLGLAAQITALEIAQANRERQQQDRSTYQ